MLRLIENADGYDREHPSHQVYPSAEFEKDANDNLRMRTFNGVVALTIDGLNTQADVEAVKQAAKILHYTLAAFVGPSGQEVIILVRIAKTDGSIPIDEDEANSICQQGHRLATSIYQGLMPKPISQEPASVRTCFRMPLDAEPYFNPKAVALPVSEKPMASQPQPEKPKVVETPDDKDSAEVSKGTQRLMDFLNALHVSLQHHYGLHGVQGQQL